MTSVIAISIALFIIILIGMVVHIEYYNKMNKTINRLFREGRSRFSVIKSLYKMGYPDKMILNGVQRYLENSLIEREKIILTRKNDDDFNYYKREEK